MITAVGVWFYARSTRRYLYLMRNDPKHPDSWSLCGGKSETGESLLATIERECREELGSMPEFLKLVPIERFTSNDEQFVYNTFFCVVETEFTPVLNDEHRGYAWIDEDTYPRPMHPGLYSTVSFEAIREKLIAIKNSV